MDLKARLEADLKEAMKAKNQAALRTVRSLRAALLEKEIAERHGGEATLDEQQVLAVLQKQAKQRRDSIAQFEEAGRDDLVQTEKEELEIIESYLPKQMGDAEIRAVLQEVIASAGATSAADLGKVMGPAMTRLRGLADGKRINEVARELLG